jgi:hypothetical protein
MPRVLQWCEACRQADDHPRHHHVDENNRVVTLHIDCCAEAGCPDGSCDATLKESNNAHGSDLIAHVESRALSAEAANG